MLIICFLKQMMQEQLQELTAKELDILKETFDIDNLLNEDNILDSRIMCTGKEYYLIGTVGAYRVEMLIDYDKKFMRGEKIMSFKNVDYRKIRVCMEDGEGRTHEIFQESHVERTQRKFSMDKFLSTPFELIGVHADKNKHEIAGKIEMYEFMVASDKKILLLEKPTLNKIEYDDICIFYHDRDECKQYIIRTRNTWQLEQT